MANGADVEAKNKNGDVPVNAALRAGHGDVAEYLLANTPKEETTTPAANVDEWVYGRNVKIVYNEEYNKDTI